MEWDSLELKVISCRGLKTFNYFQKLSVYSVVSIFDDEVKKKVQPQSSQQRQKTPIDREGGRNPDWNHTMQLDLKALSPRHHGDHLFLRFDLRCVGVMFGNKTIGEVHVPIKDLIDEFNGAVRFVSYQVRTSCGKPNGVLNFSYELKGKAGKRGRKHVDIGSPSQIQFSSEKVQYPSMEVDEYQARDIRYPSLDDVQFPSPKVDCWRPEIYCMTPQPPSSPHMMPPLPPSPPMVPPSRADYHPYPSPFIQIPASYCYPLESVSYGDGSCATQGLAS